MSFIHLFQRCVLNARSSLSQYRTCERSSGKCKVIVRSYLCMENLNKWFHMIMCGNDVTLLVYVTKTTMSCVNDLMVMLNQQFSPATDR